MIRHIGLFVLGVVVSGSWAWAHLPLVAPPTFSSEEPPAPLVLDRIEETLPPVPRSPQEEDRLKAQALYAAARIKQRQGKLAKALAMYQRAFRLDPHSYPILEEIVALSFRLNRADQAIRYAEKAAQLGGQNRRFFQVLADFLTRAGKLEKAAQFYRRVLELEKPQEKKTAQHVLVLMQLGKLYALQGKHKQAATAFREVLHALEHAKEYGIDARIRARLLGNAAATYRLMGQSFLEAGELNQAEEAFRTAHAVSRDQPTWLFHQAQLALRRNQPQKALEHLEKYFQLKGTARRLQPYELLVQVLKKLGREKELLPLLQKLHKADPQNVYLALFLGQQLAQAKQWTAAVSPLEKVSQADLKANPDYAPVVAESLRLLVRCAVQDQNTAVLARSLGRVIDVTGELDIVEDEVKALLKRKPLVEKLLQHVAGQAKQGQAEFGSLVAAALVAIQAGKPEAAKPLFTQALQMRPEEEAALLMNWGLALLVDHPKLAVEVFRRAVEQKVNPDGQSVFLLYLALSLELSGNTDEALKIIGEAIRSAPGNPQIESRRAWILYHAGRYEEARQEYLELLKKYRDNYENQAVRQVVRTTRMILSNIAVIQDDLPEAERWLEEVLDEFPDDPGALNDLGYLWADQGKHLHRALEMIQKAVAAEPDNAAYLDSLGWVLFRLGRLDEAVRHLERSVELLGEEPDGVVLDHLGDVYQALGRHQDAVRLWERALKALDPKTEQKKIEQVRRKLHQAKAPQGNLPRKRR